MKEEEKEAIECLELVLDNESDIETEDLTNKCINNILNLVKKQQKEIEKYRKLRADIIKVNKKIYDVDIIEDMCEQLANSISKDKIRELREIDNIDLIQFKLKKLLGE